MTVTESTNKAIIAVQKEEKRMWLHSRVFGSMMVVKISWRGRKYKKEFLWSGWKKTLISPKAVKMKIKWKKSRLMFWTILEWSQKLKLLQKNEWNEWRPNVLHKIAKPMGTCFFQSSVVRAKFVIVLKVELELHLAIINCCGQTQSLIFQWQSNLKRGQCNETF